MPRVWTFETIKPGHPWWDQLFSPAAKAERAAHRAQRERILQVARAKGWRHWQGSFWKALERQLKSIGCEDPAWLLKDLRRERAWAARYDGTATKAELKLCADEEEGVGD